MEDRDLYVFGDCEYSVGKKLDSAEEIQSKDERHIPQYVSFLEPGRCKVDILCMGKNISLIVIEGLVFGWGSVFCKILLSSGANELSSNDIHLLYSNKSDPCISISCSEGHIVLATSV